ncbi:MAG: hypothetical protein GY953_16600 [bacterium]|nr:hypothetical protein [bacterium]
MADRLFLSYWIRGYTEHNMLRHYERMLRAFPFSRLRPRAELRAYALELAEPPMVAQELGGGDFVEAAIETAGEFLHDDSAYLLETSWDIWQHEDDWKLEPAPVTLSCYGPRFPSEYGEQLAIEFGLDTNFLPATGQGDHIAPIRHNIRGLLHLVDDLDQCLAVVRRRLWSESGENLGDKLAAALQDS